MASLQKYVQINALAVACLKNNKPEDAIQLTKIALNGLYAFDDQTVYQSKHPKSTFLISVDIMTSEQCRFLNTSCNLFTFFPRAFYLEYSNPQEVVFSHVLTALVYNLSLATHVKFLQKGAMDQQRLLQVLSLYQNGLKLAQYYFSQDDHIHMLPLKCALVNNQGFAFSESLHFQGTRERLALLINLLSTVTASCAHIADDDYRIFFESACIYLDGVSDLCLAPAA